jgi:hypothetical protein
MKFDRLEILTMLFIFGFYKLISIFEEEGSILIYICQQGLGRNFPESEQRSNAFLNIEV